MYPLCSAFATNENHQTRDTEQPFLATHPMFVRPTGCKSGAVIDINTRALAVEGLINTRTFAVDGVDRASPSCHLHTVRELLV